VAGDQPPWAFASRLVTAAGTVLVVVSAYHWVGAASVLAAAGGVVVYVALATGLETARRRAHPIRRDGVAVADVAAVALCAWVAGRAGLPALTLVATVPAVAIHAWSSGRPGGRQVGVVAAGLVVAIGAATGHQAGWAILIGATVAVVVAGVWMTEVVVGLAAAERDAVSRSHAIDRFRREIVTTVSHELRTPLAVILGLTSTLNKRWDRMTEPQRMDLIDAIALNVASLDSSVLHFIDAGRLERGEYELIPEWVDLIDVVDAVQTKLTGALAGHRIQLALRAERIWADREAVSRILELLLANAARFAPVGSPITIRAVDDGSVIELAVIDRGPGIPPHQLPHVFEAFWRADVSETGISRGAGLGLSIVRQLAERHGGTVQARSTRQRGTTMLVELPRPPADASEAIPGRPATRRIRRAAAG
jgi:signal transduction histidine kinase